MTTESLRTTPEQRTYIRTLFAKNSKALSADQLVKAAEAQNSPIHDLFTWNNRRAGHLYRLREAARILRSYTGWLPSVMKADKAGKEKHQVSTNKVPMAVKVRPALDEAPKWVQTANALEDEYMRRQVISDRIGRVKTAIQQLLVVPELEDLYEQLMVAIDRYKIQAVPQKQEATKNEKMAVKKAKASRKELADVRT